MNKLALDGGMPLRSDPWPERGARFGQEELVHLREAIEQNTLFYMYGDKTKQVCEKMSDLCGTEYVTACSSGSAAIHGALKACGVGPGDEVITSPITDAGTLVGIVYEGAIPVFADIDPVTYSISAETVAERITDHTRAIVAVHLAGCPADIRPMVELCEKHDLKLVEDCAQSWNAKVDGQWVGTFGDVGCFSLNDFKHISAGEGGLIVTDSEDLYLRAWRAVDKCYDRVGGKRDLPFAAPNYRISELQSAVGLAQLGKVEQITEARHQLGTRLTESLAKIDGVHPHRPIDGAYGTYWFYLIRLETEELEIGLEKFAEAMNAEGIPGRAGYVDPVYLSYIYLQNRSAFNHSEWPFSQSEIHYSEG
ncbi:MAG: DegT/DnrJ/EryC1/StrS family aminotransferase, partial [Planctomycetes bacterium]|nr:DegT/DnrJ/EryC1/StrS family aminotransferase [Planctomycetota bacterium]